MALQAVCQNHKLSRLHILSYSLAGLVLVLSACATGTGSTGNTGSGNTQAVPTQIPAGPVKHIVFFIKENRTFDNYFGTYPGANGATTAMDSEGKTVALQHEADQIPDIDHSSRGARMAYDNGKMDRFALLKSGSQRNPANPYGNNSLTQLHQSDIPDYWTYAQNFVLG